MPTDDDIDNRIRIACENIERLLDSSARYGSSGDRTFKQLSAWTEYLTALAKLKQPTDDAIIQMAIDSIKRQHTG